MMTYNDCKKVMDCEGYIENPVKATLHSNPIYLTKSKSAHRLKEHSHVVMKPFKGAYKYFRQCYKKVQR